MGFNSIGGHIELCDWCVVGSDQFGGSSANFHSITKSKPTLTKKVDGKKSNDSNSLRRRSAIAYTLKRERDESDLTIKYNDQKYIMTFGLTRSLNKTNVKNSSLAPLRNRQRMKLLHEIMC